MEIIEKYIVPWALRGEEIPFHLRWNPITKYDKITITLPEGFMVTDIINIKQCSACDQDFIIDKLAEDGFFGLAIKSEMQFSSQFKREKLKISFLEKEKVIHYELLSITLVRPIISILETTNEITLDDTIDNSRCPSATIHLQYIGFGDAYINVGIKVGGHWEQTGERFYYELLKLFSETDTAQDDGSGKSKVMSTSSEDGMTKISNGHGLEVTYQKQAIMEELRNYLERFVFMREIPPEFFEQENIDNLKRWLDKKVNQPELNELLYSNLDRLLLEVLVNALKRNPSDNIFLQNADTSAIIKSTTDKIDVEVSYKDAMDNPYESLTTCIKVADKRTKPSLLHIPIQLKIDSKVIDISKEMG